ncbi:hypothetical protein [Acetobacter vaccinii]|uniref:Uncharacterized protein n=1 Tax=Acetobacter vaccinii TaxID=2592655 RepID=A0A5C1YLK3_9PROT|nr:hypothetical protein [Acetobacter vaccinii]QEO17156.1 hypothetical protein FLP30_04905 [Acetobacter vaccinii]
MVWKKTTLISLWLMALSLAICSTFIFIACGLKFSTFHSGLNVGYQEFTNTTRLSQYLWQSLPESKNWSDYALSLPGLAAVLGFITSIALGSFSALRLEELSHSQRADRMADMHRWEALLVGQHSTTVTERA